MKTYQGKVVSTKMNQTVVVAVDRMIPHAKYLKKMRRTSKFHAHNELAVKTGDTVKIGEIKPMSKTKTFKVLEVIK